MGILFEVDFKFLCGCWGKDTLTYKIHFGLVIVTICDELPASCISDCPYTNSKGDSVLSFKLSLTFC